MKFLPFAYALPFLAFVKMGTSHVLPRLTTCEGTLGTTGGGVCGGIAFPYVSHPLDGTFGTPCCGNGGEILLYFQLTLW
jgi:hypothetical protein